MSLPENAMIPFLRKLDAVPFLVRYEGKDYRIGDETPAFTVNIKKELSIKDLSTSTSLALGEAYMCGDIEIEGDLYHALSLFMGQMSRFSTDQKKLKKLYLKPGMKLLDIGCGWGALLIRAAREYGVSGVGITLSREQQKRFEERIREEGLSDLLTVKRMDYRDLPKSGYKFDRIVSVGMVEHVGRDNYGNFLSCACSVLRPKGLFLLHFISALKEHPGDPWIKKYIFPGGVVPSLRELINAAADYQFYTLDIESLRRHYNKTLLCWNENFQKHRDEVQKMFDEKFVRMWELYLCACAATFYNGIIDLHQVLFSKGVNNELPMTRWY